MANRREETRYGSGLGQDVPEVLVAIVCECRVPLETMFDSECISYSSSRVSGSEAVNSSNSGDFIQSW